MGISRRRLVGLLLALLALGLLGAASQARADDVVGPDVAIPFPLFPTDNPWNTRVDTLPVDANSAAYLASMGLTTGLHADFGTIWDGAPNGIPYVCVTGTQKKVPVTFEYADESDPGPYPIPSNAPIEGGPSSDGDRHVLVLDVDHQLLYELYAAYPQADGSWRAGFGSGLRPGQQRPAARRLDVGRRGRAAHPAGPRALRRGRHRGGHRPRPALHRGAHAEGLHLPGDPRGEQLDRPRPAAHGPARAPEGRLRHLRFLARGAGHPPGAQDLRHDGRRQRLELVRLGRPRPALERRRPARARSGQGQRLRGRRHALAAARRHRRERGR